MQPWLSKAAQQLRDQVDTWYPDRDTASDGWVGDSRHATTKSESAAKPINAYLM